MPREFKPAEIIRQEVVVVESFAKNDYGDIIFQVKGGGEHKLGAKRVDKFGGLLVVGQAVQLSYAEYMNKEYVAEITAVKEGLFPPTQPKPMPVPQTFSSPPGMPPKTEPSKPLDKPSPERIAPQAVGMTTKEIGDMIRAGKLSTIFGQETADKLVAWYKSQILQNTGLVG